MKRGLIWWFAALFLVPLGFSFVAGWPPHGYGHVWYALPLILLWWRPAHRKRLALFGVGWLLQFLAYPEIDLGFFGWVMLIPYLIAREQDDGASWWRAAYLFGFYRALTGYYWLGWTHYTAWIGVAIGSPILFVLFFELSLRRLTMVPYALRVATGWILYEWTHSLFLGGFPWLFLAHSQYLYLPVIQIADIIGAYGLSFLMAYVQAAALRRTRGEVAVAGVFLAGIFGYGFARTGPEPENGPVVLMVQTAVPHAVKAIHARRGNTGATLVELTRAGLSAHPDTALVVWPETMFPGRLIVDDPVRSTNWDSALRFARSIERPVIYGINSYATAARLHRGYNSAALVGADGKLKGIYRKQHLVPMGEEFLPRRLFSEELCDKWFDWLVENVGMNRNADLERGEGYATLDAGPGLRCGVLICFEGLYPNMGRGAANTDRPDLLLHPMNNGWFGESWAQRQSVAAWVFRAVETRTPFYSCANGGITCVVGPRGNVLGRVDKVFETGFLALAAPRRWPDPFFLHGGHWILPGGLVLAGLAFWAVRRRRSPG